MRESLLVILACALGWTQPAASQDLPLTQEQLLEALQAGGLTADRIAESIRRRGLQFEMSGAFEQKFRTAGANDTVVVALWEKEQWTPPTGEPLTKDFLMGLLQAGTPQRLPKWITVRKVNFELNPETANDLRRAGASNEVLALVSTNNVWVLPKVTYEQLVAKASEALKAGKFDDAETAANAAKIQNQNRPEAFSIIGAIYLYHFGSFSKAYSEYRSAIEKGGVVIFNVRHVDHVSKLGKIDYCNGQLQLKKGSLVFRSDRAEHNLELNRQQIVEARFSAGLKTPPAKKGVQLFASQGGDRPAEIVFHAARPKNDKDEERIIVDMINLIRQ
jgi:hypothetical protein